MRAPPARARHRLRRPLRLSRPCNAPLHASKNLRAALLIGLRGPRGKSCAAITQNAACPAARAVAGADQEERATMDVYSVITERIIEKLESGTVPWHKPWRSIGAPPNLVSKKLYRGINIWLLTTQSYISPYWATIRQINGYILRRGNCGGDDGCLSMRNYWY